MIYLQTRATYGAHQRPISKDDSPPTAPEIKVLRSAIPNSPPHMQSNKPYPLAPATCKPRIPDSPRAILDEFKDMWAERRTEYCCDAVFQMKRFIREEVACWIVLAWKKARKKDEEACTLRQGVSTGSYFEVVREFWFAFAHHSFAPLPAYCEHSRAVGLCVYVCARRRSRFN